MHKWYDPHSSDFDSNHDSIYRVLDHLLAARLVDGGWNCEHRRGAKHSSLHTTLSVLEGLHEYRKAGHSCRKQEAMSAEQEGVEFLLKHQLFQSDRTGRVIDGRFLRLAYPSRWRYDILRALDYLQAAGFRYDLRMDEALEVLLRKRRQDGRWLLGAHHAGQTHFPLEQAGQPSRWNTLRALRVFKQLT